MQNIFHHFLQSAQSPDFFGLLVDEVRSGILLFSTPKDFLLMLIDVAITSFIYYSILKIMYQTRAWQVLKGLIWILILTQVARFTGLQALGYILTASISILALAFVVLFQPELRQALESVGRNAFYNVVSTGRGEAGDLARSQVRNLIEQIVIACDNLAESFTGALIVIERQTSLGEIIEQGQAVILRAEVTSTLLEQIFYMGSPLHDGAVLIRDNIIYAARCHIPLSDNISLRRSYGTRHRAAVGVSEIGDAIGIVVSEERGTISLAIEGRLYPLDNADALRTILHRLLLTRGESQNPGLWERVKLFFKPEPGREVTEDLNHEKDVLTEQVERRRRYDRYGMQIISFVLALTTWFYAQVMTNPIRTRSFTVAAIAENVELLDEYNLGYSKESVRSVSVVIKAREKNLNQVENNEVTAVLDFADIDLAQLIENDALNEPVTMEVHVEVQDLSESSYQVTSRIPSQMKLSLYVVENESDGEVFERMFPNVNEP